MPQQLPEPRLQGNRPRSQDQPGKVGVVVIGRNEGDRLKRSLTSLRQQTDDTIAYVDSGSSDGSVAFATSIGCKVVELDPSIPFSMARGRNAGFETLTNLDREPEFVQFVDGDCEVELGWLKAAMSFLDANQDAAVVCGFLKERYPSASVYNHLAGLEWQGPTGSVHACGGNAMYRVEAFKTAGRFNERMIAGEEAELCVRLRQAGTKIWRLNLPMAIHDAAILRFGQWWTRALRGGYAYAHGWHLHGSTGTTHNATRLISTLLYGAMLPLSFVLLSIVLKQPQFPITSAAIPLLAYLKPLVSAYRFRRRLGNTRKDASIYACFCTLAKLPESIGALKYLYNQLRGRRSLLIEYKNRK